MKHFLSLALLLLLASCVPGTRYTLQANNDLFKPTQNNDRDFTHNTQFAADVPDDSGSTHYFLGQSIYTPPNKHITTPQLDQRPYAGYLYTGADWRYRKGNIQDSYGATIGVVGPYSFAEQSQSQVHRWLGQSVFEGWDNQLDNELGVILKAERAYLYPVNQYFDFVNTFGAHLGNVFTQAYAGTNFRVGINLSDAFFTPAIVYPRGTAEEQTKLSYYLFGGPSVRAVARNIFIDESAPGTTSEIDRETFVGEIRIGAAIEQGNWRVAYTYVCQSQEYTGEGHNDFGEIALSTGW